MAGLTIILAAPATGAIPRALSTGFRERIGSRVIVYLGRHPHLYVRPRWDFGNVGRRLSPCPSTILLSTKSPDLLLFRPAASGFADKAAALPKIRGGKWKDDQRLRDHGPRQGKEA